MLSFRCHCFLCEQLLTERDQCNPFLSPNFTQILSHWYYFSHCRIIAGLRMVEEKPRWRSGHLISTPDVLCKATFITNVFFGWTTARVFCSKFITHCSHWLSSNFLNLNLSEEANCAPQMYPAKGTESNSFHINCSAGHHKAVISHSRSRLGDTFTADSSL